MLRIVKPSVIREIIVSREKKKSQFHPETSVVVFLIDKSDLEEGKK